VRSGLDDTMKCDPTIYDYRIAACVIAILKLARSYYDPGLAGTPVE
jgi:hypothetical protein